MVVRLLNDSFALKYTENLKHFKTATQTWLVHCLAYKSEILIEIMS